MTSRLTEYCRKRDQAGVYVWFIYINRMGGWGGAGGEAAVGGGGVEVEAAAGAGAQQALLSGSGAKLGKPSM